MKWLLLGLLFVWFIAIYDTSECKWYIIHFIEYSDRNFFFILIDRPNSACLVRNKYKLERSCSGPHRKFFAFHRIILNCVAVHTKCPQIHKKNEYPSLKKCQYECAWHMKVRQSPNQTTTDDDNTNSTTGGDSPPPPDPPAGDGAADAPADAPDDPPADADA